MAIMQRYGFEIVFTSQSGGAEPRGICLSAALEGSQYTSLGVEEVPRRSRMDQDQEDDDYAMGRPCRRRSCGQRATAKLHTLARRVYTQCIAQA
jgi:hypothetical protein